VHEEFFSYSFLLDNCFEIYISMIFCCLLSVYSFEIYSDYDYFNNLLMIACLTISIAFIPLSIYKIYKSDPKDKLFE